MKTVISIVFALGLAALGVALWRYSEADDAPGGVVFAFLLIVGALVLGVRTIQRRR